MRSLVCVLCCVFSWGLLSIGRAHVIDQVYAELKTEGKSFSVQVVIDAGYCLPEYRGDNDVAAPDTEWINGLSEEEHARLRQEAENYFRETLTFFQSDEVLNYAISFPDYEKKPYKFYESMFGAPTLRLNLEGDFLSVGGKVRASWQDPYQASLLVVVKKKVGDWNENISIPMGPRTQKDLRIEVEPFEEETASGNSSEPKVTVTPKRMGWLEFVKVGFDHVVPDGLDHILFVVGLFLFSPKWRPLLYQSLAFTVAHSVTLALSLLGVVGFSGKWVEALIALSIVYVAVENLRAKEDEEVGWRRLALVFGFGLLHGLGFGSMLRAFLPSEDIVGPVIGFNVGVELGQIAVLAVCFLAFGWFAKHFKWVRIPGSVVIAAIGLFWVFERALS